MKKKSSPSGMRDTKHDFFNRWFTERELILRRDGEVRFLRLSPRLQLGASICAVAFALWTGGVSITGWLQHRDIQNKAGEIVEAKLSYENLRRDIDRFETRMNGLNKRVLSLIGSQENAAAESLENEIRQFGELGAELRKVAMRLSMDLDLPEKEKDKVIISRESLHDQISQLEENLNISNQRIENLQADITSLTDVRDQSKIQREKISMERDKLLMSVSQLEGQLDISRDKNAALTGHIADINKEMQQTLSSMAALENQEQNLQNRLSGLDMDYTKLTRAHHDTQNRIALVAKNLSETALDTDSVQAISPSDGHAESDLERLEKQSKRVIADLAQTRQEKEKMAQAVKKVLGGLARVAGHDRRQQHAGQQETDQILSLLGQVEGLHDLQLEMVAKLDSQASANIVQVENLIRTTGMDPERMLEISGLPIGQGGPFVETDFSSGSAENLEIRVAALENKVMRWDMLQKITRCMPMVSPVDHYNLTSKFGKRKDPFTGKPAMHKGLDMAGWPGTSVWASAAGKVTFAGSNGRYGRMVEIDHGCGIKTIYGHLKEILVKTGEKVEHRHRIGKLGSTGRSTGPHVHFEIRVEGQAVDPLKFIEAGRHVFKG